jgi:hypothetical protein
MMRTLRYACVTLLVLLLPMVAHAQNRFESVRITSVADNALCVGQVAPATTCVGGIKAGKGAFGTAVILVDETTSGIRIDVSGGVARIREGDGSADGPLSAGATTFTALQTIRLTTVQQEIGYDASNYYRTTVSSTGGVTLNAVGASASFTFSDDVRLAEGTNLRLINGSQPYSNLFSQSNSAATVLANGMQYSASVNGFASSVSSSWAKSAVFVGNGIVAFYTDTATTVAAGTDITPTARMRINTDGNVGIATTSPSARLHVISTTEQVRIGYDVSNYYSTTVSSAGAVTFNAVGASSAFAFSDAVSIGGGASITNSSNIAQVNAANTMTNANPFLFQSASGPLVRWSDGTTIFGGIGSYLSVVGSGNVDDFIVSSTNGKSLFLRSPSGFPITFMVGSNNYMVLSSTGTLAWGGGSAIGSSNNVAQVGVANTFTQPQTAPQWLVSVNGYSNTDGQFSHSNVSGTVLQLKSGSSYDWNITTPGGGSNLMLMPTGTRNTTWYGSITAAYASNTAQLIADNTTTTASNRGGAIALNAEGVNHSLIAATGTILGTTAKDTGYLAQAGYGHYWFVNGSGTPVMSLSSSAVLTVTNTIVGSINGNAATATLAAEATALETARTINGVSFDGTGNINITVDAADLTGTTLDSGITASSLTSVGTLSSLTVSGVITGGSYVADGMTGCSGIADEAHFGIVVVCSSPEQQRTRILGDLPDQVAWLRSEIARLTALVATLGGGR